MESQEETLAVSSSKRSEIESPRSSTADVKETPTYLKLLVSNMAAGSIIGRGGVNITELQSLSGARVQLSRNNEFFPGTSDRIIVISGVVDEIMKAVELILEKLEDEAEEISDADPRSQVRLVVPNGSCGGIIGKGGSTIKSFIEESHAGIKVLPQDNNYLGLNDRLVMITGSLEECIYAIDLIMLKLVEDARYSPSAISPYPYASVAFGYSNPSAAYTHIPNGVGGNYISKKGLMPPVSTRTPAASEGVGISVTIAVADEHVGAVVGRGGRNIMEIMQVSGARIKISDRDDFMPGTTDRKVTITGSRDAISAAEDMVMQKVASRQPRI